MQTQQDKISTELRRIPQEATLTMATHSNVNIMEDNDNTVDPLQCHDVFDASWITHLNL